MPREVTGQARFRRAGAALFAVVALPTALLWFEFGKPQSSSSQSEPARRDAKPAEAPLMAAATSSPPALATSAPPPVRREVPAGSDETAQLDELRGLSSSDPELAITRARLQERQFPNSALAPERSSILIHALANAGHTSEARGSAEDVVNRYPDSDWVREIEAFTGAHRHRTARLTPDGKLAFD